MCKTNEKEGGFSNFLLHRFANQTHQSIFAPSFYGYEKRDTFAPQIGLFV